MYVFFRPTLAFNILRIDSQKKNRKRKETNLSNFVVFFLISLHYSLSSFSPLFLLNSMYIFIHVLGRKGYHTPRIAFSTAFSNDDFEKPYFDRSTLPFPSLSLRLALSGGQARFFSFSSILLLFFKIRVYSILRSL